MARKTTKRRIDPGTCTLVWFARLEDALREGDRDREAEARQRLAALGVARVEFDTGTLRDRQREATGDRG